MTKLSQQLLDLAIHTGPDGVMHVDCEALCLASGLPVTEENQLMLGREVELIIEEMWGGLVPVIYSDRPFPGGDYGR